MRQLNISNPQPLLSTLRRASSQSADSAFQLRLCCLNLVAQGLSCYQLAGWFGRSPRTIERWVHNYENFGVEGLKDDKKPGRLPKLNFEQRSDLGMALAGSPRRFGCVKSGWDGSLLSAYLDWRYGVALSRRQCQRLLRQLGKSKVGEFPDRSANRPTRHQQCPPECPLSCRVRRFYLQG
ncbi:MAG: helix-turn-helix domain containing protein [Methylococcaceae bacterium]|nr:helix-turn-helix domain containing protein [Methylococcaceae bacterium]